jgi:hypothetical protein
MAQSKLYRVWAWMLSRCRNPNVIGWKNYGGRGIRVCDEWRTFAPFAAWAETNQYAPGLELDRKDNDGDYCPANCRWVSRIVNARNKRTSRKVTAFGESKTLAEWAEDPRCTVAYHALKKRLNRGLNSETAITAQPIPFGKYKRGSHVDRYEA